ncbi:hypothetical protein NMY22_g17018 [Coprinellus aureogranulatus]|nr:hypothetical protein NMY22_g17018 [Coprinellus aureogranulatus]
MNTATQQMNFIYYDGENNRFIGDRNPRDGGALGNDAAYASSEDPGGVGGRNPRPNPPDTQNTGGQGRNTRPASQGQSSLNGRDSRHTNASGRCKSSRAAMRIASINIRGGNLRSSNSKWKEAHTVLRDKSLSVLVLEETHITPEQGVSLEHRFKRIRLFVNPDPDSPTSRGGVAIMLNTAKVSWKEAQHRILIPGRASLVSIPWHNGKQVHILAIYAPSGNHAANTEFWNNLTALWTAGRNHPPKPHVVLGDMNMVETRLDRFPKRPDPEPVLNALDAFKRELNIIDGWRQMNPTSTAYTFRTHTDGGNSISMSRIDRIYVLSNLMRRSCEWEITDVGDWTDHKMVSAVIEPEGTPNVGKGRSTVPPFIVDYPETQHTLLRLVKRLNDDLANMEASGERSESANPQTLWKAFKEQIMQCAKDFTRKRRSRIDEQIKMWERRRCDVLDSADDKDADEIAILIEEIDDNINDLLKQKKERSRAATSANHHYEVKTT